MRYSLISSFLLTAFSVGVLLGSVGMYSPEPGPGVDANEFIHSRQLTDLRASQAPPSKVASQQPRKAPDRGHDKDRMQKLGPLLVLLPIFAHQGKG
jgi:hypothetical protein